MTNRRYDVSQHTTEELIIGEAISAIKKLNLKKFPPDTRLTNCLLNLMQAKEHLGDFVDNVIYPSPNYSEHYKCTPTQCAKKTAGICDNKNGCIYQTELPSNDTMQELADITYPKNAFEDEGKQRDYDLKRHGFKNGFNKAIELIKAKEHLDNFIDDISEPTLSTDYSEHYKCTQTQCAKKTSGVCDNKDGCIIRN